MLSKKTSITKFMGRTMKFLMKYMVFIIISLHLMPLNIFANQKINIHVSVLPQKYFVEKIGKDRVNVHVLVKPGKSPATYAPSPDQMKKLSSSDIFFLIKVPFENGILHKIKATTRAKIVDTTRGIELRDMEEHGQKTKGHHNHYGKDPHTWMNPANVKIQAQTIYKALIDIDPEGQKVYKSNYKLFINELDDLDKRLKSVLQDLKGENLFVFHPSFGYFTDAYGLKQVAIETMGKAPKGKALFDIIKRLKKQKTRVIFVQPQFDRNTAQKIATAINGTVLPIDPLAFDYIANMEKIANTIARTLKK
jgi:zinc transport system substrate-binding protein